MSLRSDVVVSLCLALAVGCDPGDAGDPPGADAVAQTGTDGQVDGAAGADGSEPVDGGHAPDAADPIDRGLAPDGDAPVADAGVMDAVVPSCGDGVVDPGEACDPALRATAPCAELSPLLVEGEARCTAGCRWSVEQCAAREPACGDGMVDPSETCDPLAFEPQDCAALSPTFGAGEVFCAADCTLDLSRCEPVEHACGDGVIEGGEQCDDGNDIDDDACSDDCRLMINGRASLVEPMHGPGAVRGGIFDANFACTDPALRARWRDARPATVRYRIHLCQRNNGRDVFSAAQVRGLMAQVAETYAAVGIHLVEESLVRFAYDDCQPFYEDVDFPAAVRTHTPRGVLPIVFVHRIPSFVSAFPIGGYASFGGLSVNAELHEVVLTHELGHFFGLAHTHDCFYGRERADRCDETGDLLCDTPPDRGPAGIFGLAVCADGGWLDGSCESFGCGIGRCPDGSRPDRDNWMSYYGCLPGAFSPGQSDFMRCTLDHELLPFHHLPDCEPQPEVCNARDDDCDDVIDEDLRRACGQDEGACAAGVQNCQDGVWGQCLGAIEPTDEQCNGRDDDCDGATDEVEARPCGEDAGACTPGLEACVGGAWGACEGAIGPSAEVCDGLDNDCDGASDEALTRPCGDAEGACRPGVERCVDGAWSDCDGAAGPEMEFCDGADNDCDGAVDEGLRRACGSDEGLCEVGEQTCAAGDWGDCVGEVAPTAERCNGLDDDCDGATDEAVDPALEPDRSRCPDQGVCADGRAHPMCEGGEWRCELPPDYVPVECAIVDQACGAGSLDDPTCRDGVDNDCDGLDDENDAFALCRDHPNFDRVQTGEACFAALRGRCGMGGGTYECVQLAEGCGVSIDCIGATFPAPERCDGQDWDCDGQVDDRGDDDGDGFGDCPGLVDCDEGAAGVHPGADEICNGVDDDCDEAIDEGTLNACGACGPDPVEVCNGVDDDCDDAVDEGTLNACGACGPEPAEACNNLDDDCDGVADEGLPPDCVPGTCEAPFNYPSEGGRVTGTITGTATQDGGCRHVGVDHVYRWTAPTTGMAEITATGNFNPISLFLLDGDCEGAEVACDYQPDPGATNRLSAPVVAGRTYRLVIGHGNYRGDIALRYTLNLAPPCEPAPEIPGNGRDDDCNGVVDDVCGDGQLQGAEQCDDANAATCDGCERCQRLRHLVFDPAAQSQVVVPDTAGAPLALQGTPFTVEYWGRLADVSERLDVQRRAESNRGWGLTVFEGGVIGAGYQRATVRSEGLAIVGTGWHHYAWTWDGATTRLFFDGQQVDEGAPEGDELVRDVAAPVHIGSFRDADGVVTLYNQGAIDEIRISSVARYDGPFTPARRHTPDAATLALWHADEGAGDRLVDASALSHHGDAQSVGWAADEGYGRFCE